MNVREVIDLFYDLAAETDRTSDRSFALELVGTYVNSQVHGRYPQEWIPAVTLIVRTQIAEHDGEMREGFVEALEWMELVAAEYGVSS